ncbi:hypothetical protein HDU83_000908 [Entophlyctis luteolus]|nr:hypothetical protein HDU82_007387 [Entophlyctis luteolus]KAJ3348987.1 hypothetical protein HDU83_000908 [Entophlyctis luteolus]KAJ3379439.1 hypothetical protein HDU84_006685 [Entophlyctis sp. JEL0112]
MSDPSFAWSHVAECCDRESLYWAAILSSLPFTYSCAVLTFDFYVPSLWQFNLSPAGLHARIQYMVEQFPHKLTSLSIAKLIFVAAANGSVGALELLMMSGQSPQLSHIPKPDFSRLIFSKNNTLRFFRRVVQKDRETAFVLCVFLRSCDANYFCSLALNWAFDEDRQLYNMLLKTRGFLEGCQKGWKKQ